MNARSISPLLLIVALSITTLPAAAATTPQVARRSHRVASPFVVKGPRAIPSGNNVGKNSDIFTCQVGLTPPFVCYDPYQMRHAYNIDTLISAGFTGKGKTIVIVDAFQSPNMVDALNAFDETFDLPGLNGLGAPPDRSLGTFKQVAPDGLTPFDPTDGNMISWAEEISLDVEWAHAIAPGANITLVLAASNDDADILSATKYAVDHNLGDVISQSFGENESCVDSSLLAAQHKLFVKATLKHITLIASSGDDGAAQGSCDGTSFVRQLHRPPAIRWSPPWAELNFTPPITACWTSAAIPATNPAPGTYQSEIAWNEADLGFGATGGGFSVLYRTPFYQLGSVSLRRGRGVPDVAYDAAVAHGVLTYLDIPGIDPGIYLFGGTSAGSPQWAGIVAIAGQKAGRRLGFINGTLYLFSAFPKFYAALFNDVTSGDNSILEEDAAGNPVQITGFNARRKWDATTGLGSPKADQVVHFLTLFNSDSDADQAMNNSGPSGARRSGHHRVRNH